MDSYHCTTGLPACTNHGAKNDGHANRQTDIGSCYTVMDCLQAYCRKRFCMFRRLLDGSRTPCEPSTNTRPGTSLTFGSSRRIFLGAFSHYQSYCWWMEGRVGVDGKSSIPSVQPQVQLVLGQSLHWLGASWWTCICKSLALGVQVCTELPQPMQDSNQRAWT